MPGFDRGLNSEDLLDARKKNGWEGLSSRRAKRQELLERREQRERERTGGSPIGMTLQRRNDNSWGQTDKEMPSLHKDSNWLKSSRHSGLERMYNKGLLIYILAENVLSVCGTL